MCLDITSFEDPRFSVAYKFALLGENGGAYSPFAKRFGLFRYRYKAENFYSGKVKITKSLRYESVQVLNRGFHVFADYEGGVKILNNSGVIFRGTLAAAGFTPVMLEVKPKDFIADGVWSTGWFQTRSAAYRRFDIVGIKDKYAGLVKPRINLDGKISFDTKNLTWWS